MLICSHTSQTLAAGYTKFLEILVVDGVLIAYSITRIILYKEDKLLTRAYILYFLVAYIISKLSTNATIISELHRIYQLTISLDSTIASWRKLMDNIAQGLILETNNQILYSNSAILGIYSLPAETILSYINNNTNHQTQILTIGIHSAQWELLQIQFGIHKANLYILTKLPDQQSTTDTITDEIPNKDFLLATITHELRSPLNTIKLFLSSLRENVYNGSENDELCNALSAASMQEILIDDILDFSKAKYHKLQLSVSKINFKEFVNSTVNLVKLQCKYKGIKIRICIDHSFPHAISTDERRMKQVFLNLLSNSMKFTLSNGQITVSAYKGKENLLISVSDTGCGMSSQEIDKLFKPFSMSDSSRSLNKSGSGIGLYLSKILVEKMGGTISVNSYVGLGTTFSLLFPIENDDDFEPGISEIPKVCNAPQSILEMSIKAPRQDHISMKAKSRRYVNPSMRVGLEVEKPKVLVVDDEPMCLFALKTVLEKKGANVLGSSNIMDACKIVMSVKEIRLGILDINLGMGTGYALADKLKTLENYLSNPFPLVALSGEDTISIKEKCLSKGFAQVLKKPVDVKVIDKLIQEYNIE